MIRCLSKEVQCKLRSGVAIYSLQQCVEEVILNSIDAGATCVGVRVDMDAYKVQVIDNGCGMGIEDMERLGNRYCTSKCATLEDLDNLRFYGFRGEAVASIVSLAMLVEISSRTKLSVKTHVKVFKDGKGLDIFEAKTTRPSAGTTVIICNFFHNMPVRRKRMDAVLECERIRQRVEAISLMLPSISFTLKNDCTGAMVVQLSKAQNTYYRFVQIHGLGRAQRLGAISHSHEQFEVIGYIGREGHYNNGLQFLFVNDRLLLKTRIHKLLNFLLRKISSSNQKNNSPDVPSTIKSPKQRRGPESHGVYVMNIKCHYSEYDICLEPSKTLIEFKDWDGIMFCVEEAVKTFLTRENLMVELSPDDMEYAGHNLFCEQSGCTGIKEDYTTRGDEAQIDHIGGTLTSVIVHRSSKNDFDTEDTVGLACGTDKIQGDKRGNCGEDNDSSMELYQEEVHSPMNMQFAISPDSGREATQSITHSNLMTVTEKSESVPHKDNVEEMKLNTLLNVGDESHDIGSSIVNAINRSSIEHPQAVKDKCARIQNEISISNSSGEALSMVIREQNTSCAEDITPQRQKIRLDKQTMGCNAKIYLPNGSLNCTFLQHKPGLSMRCQENLSTKRSFSFVENLGYGKVGQRECNDPPAIPSKISKVMPFQKLTLSKEVSSLDKFRRIYGKLSEIKSHPVDTNSNCSETKASTSQAGYSVMAEKGNSCDKEENEKAVIKSQLDRQDDHKSPLTLSMFTKLKPLSGQCNNSGMSLAAKLSHRKQQFKTAVRGCALAHSKEGSLNEDTSTEDTLAYTIIQNVNSEEQVCDTNDNNGGQPSSSSPPLAGQEVTASSDWLHHYDDSVGKLVYVNTVTGLSRYEEPNVGETQMSCTSDVTNMAVSVISKKGNETLTSNSLSSLYSEWTNPVFERPPMVGVDISVGQAEGLVVKIHNILFPYRFSKDMIHSMKVIDQVDKKFLACLIDTRDQECTNNGEDEGNLLVLVDQHAAHERVRLENLIADSYEDDPEAPGERRLCSSTIAPPLVVMVTEEDLRMLRSCEKFLRGLALELQFSQTGNPQVLVSKVPVCFTEKESNELRRGRQSVIKPIVEEYLQEQIELLRLTGRVRGSLPLTVLKVLASLACHGAIKFNDSLNKDECCSLVASLSSCQLPFQCAHGRPSIAPLVDILHLKSDHQVL